MFLRVAALLTMLAAGLLVTSAGAGGGTVSAPRALDLSTMKEIKSYLRSLGVNPKSVVIQRAKKNYAGPNCPGEGWACTKGTRVLQVGSQNSFECTEATTEEDTGGTQICIGAQDGERNTFRCIERTRGEPAEQRCGVTQIGVSNYALFEQVADQSTSTNLTQEASQLVEVHQQTRAPAFGETSSPRNQLHVYQRVKQSMTTPTTTTPQMQDAHQFVIPSELELSTDPFPEIQDAIAGGNNYSDINQFIDQRASGAAIAQKQNTGGLPTIGPVADPFTFEDCVAGSPIRPNQCVEGSQDASGSGRNLSQLHQLIDQDARSTLAALAANPQTQGDAAGGIEARIHQDAGNEGRSESHAHQAMRQNVAGAEGSVQIQTDPTRCCGVSQEDGTNNMQDINQASSQNSDENATQNATLIGECKTEEGTCSVHHHGRNDNANESFSQSCESDSEEACTFTRTTHCESFETEAGGVGGCPIPDEGPDLTGVSLFTATNFLPGTVLTGFEITMGLVEPTLPSSLP